MALAPTYSLTCIEYETGSVRCVSDYHMPISSDALLDIQQSGVVSFAEMPQDRRATYRTCLRRTMGTSRIPRDSVKGIVFAQPSTQWSSAEEADLMIALASLGFDQLPVIGLNLQGCSAFAPAASQSAALSRDEDGPILMILSGLPECSSNYDSDSGRLFSFGVASAIVVAGRGSFNLLGTVTKTDLWLATHSKESDPEKNFKHSYNLVKSTVGTLLSDVDIRPDDIAILCGTNVNALALSTVGMITKIPSDRIWYGGLAEVGHLYSGDALVALSTLRTNGRVKKGDFVLVAGWSPSTFSATMMRADEV